ncbi:hypothetical protein CBER1_03366 [Cercospora berteroae]|uniref:Uncharacterized protein n=1 Tax=Cercospora berteroae TaxID=357750 RepID=A0A2S6C8I8_9PEZI|nr:hypothetical protein CBER1_03366 [Cercospora berteroae]
MNLFKLSAKTLAILGLLIVNNLVIASPLNITSADPSDQPSDDPSDEPSGKPDDPQDNQYYRCDPGRGRGEFSPNYYSKPPWPILERNAILYTPFHLRNEVWYEESRDLKKTSVNDLLYCLNDMYHSIYTEEPGISDEEHHRRLRKEGYKKEGAFGQHGKWSRPVEDGLRKQRKQADLGLAVRNVSGGCGNGANFTANFTANFKANFKKGCAAPTSKPTSKPAPEPEDPKPTSEPGGQKPALEPVCTNYCGGLSKAYNGTKNVLDRKEELDNTPAEEA